MPGFHYVYILTSKATPNRHYIGRASNLEARLARHNAGRVQATANHRPWRLETVIAFRSRTKTAAFERYLKTHSGRAFARKRF
jgi:predicted GIY-YIG superfamily endonuclease